MEPKPSRETFSDGQDPPSRPSLAQLQPDPSHHTPNLPPSPNCPTTTLPQNANNPRARDGAAPGRSPWTFSPASRLSRIFSMEAPQTLSEEREGRQLHRFPSIRLRHQSSTSLGCAGPDQPQPQQAPTYASRDEPHREHQRSTSQPERGTQHIGGLQVARSTSRRAPVHIALPRLTEEGVRPSLTEIEAELSPNSARPLQSLPDSCPTLQEISNVHPQRGRLHGTQRLSRIFRPGQASGARGAGKDKANTEEDQEYNDRLVDWLDVFDPEVQTLSTVTNVQNSLFVPDLGNLINRRPTYALSDYERGPRWRPSATMEEQKEEEVEQVAESPPLGRTNTITSHLTDSHYAALPHGTTLEGWTEEEKLELEDRVRHMLHSRRSRFKRGLKGFGKYVRTPLGFFVTLYAVLITLFGLSWVLFLIGWIYVGEKQVYAIHVIDSVLVALFAIMGDGLAPFRAIDTYHMIFIVHYYRIVKKAEKRKRLDSKNVISPPTENKTNVGGLVLEEPMVARSRQSLDLGDPTSASEVNSNDEAIDLEANHASRNADPDGEVEASVLTPKQLKSLSHHQEKLAKSHSFYKAQESFTHYSFSLSYLTAIVILLDCHSCLQISLGACTWGIDYHTRPFAITTTILCVSIACNITAGLLISIGDRKTRKKDVVALLDRQELTATAIKRVKEKKSR